MIPDLTKFQLSQLTLQPNEPLLICDVDEVIVHFVRDFEDYLAGHRLKFNVHGFQLTDDSVSTHKGESLGVGSILDHITTFFAERTLHMQAIDGAIDAIKELSRQAQVVFLTNLPAEAGDDRRANLRQLGLDAPVITNTGPKGPAIRHLAELVHAPVAFVDDSPGFIQSAFDYAPRVKTIHFLQDKRFHAYAPDFDFLGLKSDNWSETCIYLRDTLTGALAR